MSVGTRIQVRRDTAANWTTNNPTLLQGEPGFEDDDNKLKIGDGVTAWTSLPYFGGSGGGGGPVVAAAVTSSGTLVAGKFTPVDATSGNSSQALPTGAASGTQIAVQRVDATANTLTLTGSIRGVGASSIGLNTGQYETLLLTADSSGSWWPLASHKLRTVVASPQSTGTPRFTVGVTPPANPTINDLWLSTSRQDVRVGAGPAARNLLLSPTVAWETTCTQEPSMWFDGTNWNLWYSGGAFAGGGLGWATCPGSADPTVGANWTKYASNPVISPGTASGGGTNLLGAHSGAYFEAGQVYIYAPDSVGNTCVAHGATPLSLTFAGIACAKSTPNAPVIWNPRVFKRGASDYVMTFATQSPGYPSTKYSAGYALSTSPLGPFTIPSGGVPLLSLDPALGSAGTDGPVLALENGLYVGWYHAAGENGQFPTDIWRATSPDLQNWTILDNGYPVITRVAPFEVDQVADVSIITAPSGLEFAVWDALDNRLVSSHLYCAPLSPVLKRFDGAAWHPLLADSGPADAQRTVGGNVRLGMGALQYITVDDNALTGIRNTAIGSRALSVNIVGTNNTAVGNYALLQATASNNTAVGEAALAATTTGVSNTAVGVGALSSNTIGGGNTAVGPALQANTTGNSNVAIGSSALLSNVTGVGSTAVGVSALSLSTAGSNTAVGFQAAKAATTAGGIVAVGFNALLTNVAGANNTAVGSSALSLATGGSNTAIGQGAAQNASTAASNTAVGYTALNSATSGGSNTAVGATAMFSNTTGTGNTALGSLAGRGFVTGANNTALGVSAGYTDGTNTTTDNSNMTLLGYQAQATTGNVIVLGSAITANRPNLIFGGVGAAAAFGGGSGVFAIANAVTAPATTPTGGGVLYVTAGALTYKGSSGTVTTLAVA